MKCFSIAYLSIFIAFAVPVCAVADNTLAVPLVHVIGVSGQSNAGLELPVLSRLYGPTVVGVAQGATAIAAWAPDGPLWAALLPLISRPLDGFVWWQGESDVSHLDTYPAALDNLIARVRAASGRPFLPVVICGADAYPNNSPLIEVQRDYAATRQHTIFVPSDDLEMLGGYSQHLTDDGYVTMAQRIIIALAELSKDK